MSGSPSVSKKVLSSQPAPQNFFSNALLQPETKIQQGDYTDVTCGLVRQSEMPRQEEENNRVVNKKEESSI